MSENREKALWASIISKRIWRCPYCGTEHRDINAALNVRQKGIQELKAAGLVVSAHGGQRKSVVQTVAACEVGSLAQQGGKQSQMNILIDIH